MSKHSQLHTLCARDGWVCAYCKRELFCGGCEPERAERGSGESRLAATRDHVIPRSKGGRNALENLVPACESCNKDKADSMDFEEAARVGAMLKRREHAERERARVGSVRARSRSVRVLGESGPVGAVCHWRRFASRELAEQEIAVWLEQSRPALLSGEVAAKLEAFECSVKGCWWWHVRAVGFGVKQR